MSEQEAWEGGEVVCLPVGGGGVGVEVDRHHVARLQLRYDHLVIANFIFLEIQMKWI